MKPIICCDFDPDLPKHTKDIIKAAIPAIVHNIKTSNNIVNTHLVVIFFSSSDVICKVYKDKNLLLFEKMTHETCLVRFFNNKNDVIYSIEIHDENVEYDIINWFASHFGEIYHISSVFRLYAKYKYNLANESNYVKKIDVFKYKKDTVIIVKNYATGTMIRGYPCNLLEFFKKN